jgi:hypothetical protein
MWLLLLQRMLHMHLSTDTEANYGFKTQEGCPLCSSVIIKDAPYVPLALIDDTICGPLALIDDTVCGPNSDKGRL